MFAFTSSQNSKYPFGSVLPYTSEGEEVVLKDGSKHTISLLFQYKNGLFINFWKKYDAIIRHSFNQVEANVLLPVHQLMGMDILTPVALRGQYLLFDGFSYSFIFILFLVNIVDQSLTVNNFLHERRERLSLI